MGTRFYLYDLISANFCKIGSGGHHVPGELVITSQVYNLFQDLWNRSPYLGGWGRVQSPFGAMAKKTDRQTAKEAWWPIGRPSASYSVPWRDQGSILSKGCSISLNKKESNCNV